MKSTLLIIMFSITLTIMAQETIDEKEAIKTLITSAYQEGLINMGDLEAAKKGFHEGFAILMKEGEVY